MAEKESKKNTCAKCGKSLTFAERHSYTSLSLDIKHPDNPYKGKKLCESCYPEVWNQEQPKNANPDKQPETPNTPNPIDNNSGVPIIAGVFLLLSMVVVLYYSINAVMLAQNLGNADLRNSTLINALLSLFGWICLYLFCWSILYYVTKIGSFRQLSQ